MSREPFRGWQHLCCGMSVRKITAFWRFSVSYVHASLQYGIDKDKDKELDEATADKLSRSDQAVVG